MTAKEYLDQNKAGFENDSIAREKFKHIIESNRIKTVIETGTYLGSTTKWFSQWADKVYTVEVNAENYEKARWNLKDCKNVECHFGNSVDVLSKISNKITAHNISPYGGPLFLFLDAHWNNYNPLIDELSFIAKNLSLPFIAIHDFKVPGHPELGFDSYKGQDYDWEWIKESVESIYGKDGFEVEYNSEATGAKRGIIYLSPKQKTLDIKLESVLDEDTDSITD